jgi:uncharacterized SAM-binding protein YcdF (DUF218 family)
VLTKYDNIKYSLKILYLAIVFYICVATPLGANFLVSQLEVTDVDKNCMNDDVDTVVILAGGITGDPYSANEIWRLKEETYRRVLLGLEIAEKSKSKKIIVSGGYGQQFSEAVIMATLIKKIGYSGKIITDTKSKSTHASAVNVTKILMENKIEKYLLVTSSLHMLRAEQSFRNQGVIPCQYPVNSQYIDTFFPGSVLPQISALEKSTAAFHEIIGLLWYWLTGKI